MMNNKQIIDNAPEGATHVSLGVTTSYLKINQYTHWFDDGNWRLLNYARTGDIHSLSDLRRVLGLEERIAKLKKERDELLNQNARLTTFICRATEKLSGIPEFEATINTLKRPLRDNNALAKRDLEQQLFEANRLHDLLLAESNAKVMMNVVLKEINQLRQQAKEIDSD